MENHNKLTPAETERLAMLMEECAEVQQTIGKILRHGFESPNPDDPKKTTNRVLLERELGDLSFAVNFCIAREDINGLVMMSHIHNRGDTVSMYLHHNTVEDIIEVEEE